MPRLQPADINNNTFDFIIVGVLEAGITTQEELLEAQVPLLNSKMKNTHVDWKLQSVPQTNASNRSIGVPLGKLLGGSSAFNACLYHRCSPSDYDAWNEKEWTYKILQPYFRKAETFHDDKHPVPEEIYGTSGPFHVMQANYDTELGNSFRKACQKNGIPEYYDMTDMPCQIGVTGLQAAIYDGRRISAGSSYLPPELQQERANLFIGLGCKVHRIILNEAKVVTHVEYSAVDGEGRDSLYRAAVSREVILTAGAILSPYLLLSSGIGPKSELTKANVETIVDLPGVGKNLQNHWRVPLVHETTKPEMSLHRDLFQREKETLAQALNEKTGTYTRLWPDAVAYMKIPDTPDNSSSADNTPQIELFAGGLALCRDLPRLKGSDCATLLMVYVAPFSTGSITLSKEKELQIDLGLLKDDRDLECLEKGLSLSLKIANESEYKDSCVKRWLIYPQNERDIRQFILDNVETLHHYAGTCKMGPEKDKSTVVDNHLRVHGTRGLRVADASFFPIVPAGQICFPIIACAERAADLILNDNKNC
ncbi:GMC oxidoreductase-domain-containing protein [Mycotypha africana]|uniref:GMC oxidoreductase-domain-containing protein n=1 Tax=Mycotypha africana TaxID=64632 RepID=UPI002301CA60|nr:GMC oxidoreductase-domain-containing protein [Mycotypha africana]KAI8973204.1 GMC oxidoreductase-domain-containing protein [Mycotypha africana]